MTEITRNNRCIRTLACVGALGQLHLKVYNCIRKILIFSITFSNVSQMAGALIIVAYSNTGWVFFLKELTREQLSYPGTGLWIRRLNVKGWYINTGFSIGVFRLYPLVKFFVSLIRQTFVTELVSRWTQLPLLRLASPLLLLLLLLLPASCLCYSAQPMPIFKPISV